MNEQETKQKKKMGKGKKTLVIIAAIVVVFFIAIAMTPTDETSVTTSAATTQQSAEASETPTEATTENKKQTIKESLRTAIINVVDEENFVTLNYVPDNNFTLIKFKGSENLTKNYTVKGMYIDIFDILKSIQPIIDTDVDFNVVYPLQDVYGNSSDEIVIKATFKKGTIEKINFENAISDNLPIMADEWWNHTALDISE